VKLLRRIILFASSIIVLSIAVSFVTVKKKLTITFTNYAGSAVLNLDSTYKNQLGQPFTVTNIKYYICGIHLMRSDGSKYYPIHQYYLIDEHDETTRQINFIDVPEAEYTFMEFMVGVDSLHNCNGVQEGALDPTKGMFWAWNTGYIFLKFDGTSPLSKSNGRILEYHIGGYRSPNNCIRKITLNFKTPLLVNASTNQTINIKADILQLFKSPTAIDFSKLSSVVDFHNATTIANNYAGMFSLIEK
jgi:methanobactin biosynthesis MbnP-like protein